MYTKIGRYLLLWAGLANSGWAQQPPARLNLDQAISYALENSPDMHIMQERIAQADAQLGMALASFFPQVKASLAYQHSDNPAQAFAMIIAQRRLNLGGGDFNHPGGVDNYRPQVMATYSLFRGGQDYYQKQAAELGTELAGFEQEAARNQLVNHVSDVYLGYLAAQDAQTISQRAVDAVNSEVEQMQTRFEGGVALKSDVLSLQAQLAQAQDQQMQARQAMEMALSLLKTLLGMSVADPLELENSTAQPAAPDNAELLIAQAVAQHPELKAAEKRLAIAEQQLNATQAEHLPRADAFVNYGSDSKDLAYSTNRDNVSAGVMVEVDIFSGFATQEKIKKAEHEHNAAKEMLRKMRLSIENQVTSSRLRLLEAINRQQVAKAAVSAADEALRLVSEQHHAGVVTVTRFLEAEVARDNAHNQALAARYDALRAQAALNQALGLAQNTH